MTDDIDEEDDWEREEAAREKEKAPYRRLSKRLDPDKRYIFTPEKITGFHNVEQDRKDAHFNLKPSGLWYACGPEWVDWVMTDWWGHQEKWRYLYEVHVNPRQMLVIRDVEELDEFDRTWRNRRNKYSGPDWTALAKRYAGIEICPYQWSRRMDFMWYYGWDVASGCIWNERAIDGFTLVARGDEKGRWRT